MKDSSRPTQNEQDGEVSGNTKRTGKLFRKIKLIPRNDPTDTARHSRAEQEPHDTIKRRLPFHIPQQSRKKARMRRRKMTDEYLKANGMMQEETLFPLIPWEEKAEDTEPSQSAR